MRPILVFKIPYLLRPCLAFQNPFLGSYHNCIFVPQLLAICISSSFYCILASHLLGTISQFLLFLLWPHFGQIIKLSLSFITFWVSLFPVSHLTYETVKLGLQNTLNMSKTTRVYFGVLHLPHREQVTFTRQSRLKCPSLPHRKHVVGPSLGSHGFPNRLYGDLCFPLSLA